MGLLNQKNLWPTLIYQFDHLGHPNLARIKTTKYVESIVVNNSNSRIPPFNHSGKILPFPFFVFKAFVRWMSGSGFSGSIVRIPSTYYGCWCQVGTNSTNFFHWKILQIFTYNITVLQVNHFSLYCRIPCVAYNLRKTQMLTFDGKFRLISGWYQYFSCCGKSYK